MWIWESGIDRTGAAFYGIAVMFADKAGGWLGRGNKCVWRESRISYVIWPAVIAFFEYPALASDWSFL